MSGNNDRREPSAFEFEKEKLINQISENLGKLIASTNNLNRKIEANAAVGSDFGNVSKLWGEYERVMAYTGTERVQPALPLATIGPDSAGARRDDSFGITAPGGGSTSYLQ